MITEIKYTNRDHDQAQIDGKEFVPWPYTGWRVKEVAEYLQTQTVTPYPQSKIDEEDAREARRAQKDADRAAVKGTPEVEALLDLTPAEIDQWVDDNTGNVNQMREVVRIVAKLVLVNEQ